MNTSARALAVFSCAVVLSTSLAGCGGGDDKKSSSKSSVDPAVLTYRADVDDLCKAQRDGIRAPGADLTATSPAAAQKAAFRKIGDGFLALAADLKKVSAPDSIASDATKWISDFTASANQVRNSGVALLKQGARPFAQTDADAVALGLVECVTNNWNQ